MSTKMGAHSLLICASSFVARTAVASDMASHVSPCYPSDGIQVGAGLSGATSSESPDRPGSEREGWRCPPHPTHEVTPKYLKRNAHVDPLSTWPQTEKMLRVDLYWHHSLLQPTPHEKT